MPGILSHVVAGCAMFIVGRYYYRSYFDGDNKTKERLLLTFVCLSFSFIPDFFLGIYYTTHILPKCTFIPYHNFTHVALIPVAIVGLLILTYLVKTKRKSIWVMGLWSILLHIAMDFFIHTESLFF